MTEHSPAPWTIKALDGLRTVVDANGQLVRTTWNWKETECHANARLIIAAPETAAQRDELLAALNTVILNARSLPDYVYEMVTAAIDKAEGGKSVTTPKNNLEDLTDEHLLLEHERAWMLSREWAGHKGRVEFEIRQRIEARGGTALPSAAFICELKPQVSYSQPAFGPLKEILFQADLETCLVPQHDETVLVRDKWNTVKIKGFAKRYGPEVERVVEAATIPEPAKLEVKRRE